MVKDLETSNTSSSEPEVQTRSRAGALVSGVTVAVHAAHANLIAKRKASVHEPTVTRGNDRVPNHKMRSLSSRTMNNRG